MREESLSSYIWFGMYFRYLLDLQPGFGIQGENKVVANIERVLEGLDRRGLTVTARAARFQGLEKLLEQLKATKPGSTLTAAQASEINKIISSVMKTLDAESSDKKAFVTSQKRWDVERLLKDPGSMFGQEVFDGLDTHAAFDFEEACKCIAFERPTAAAFHTMRGTEATLRAFYCHTVKQKRLAKSKQMWGPMLDQMKARSKPPPRPLLDNLDSIRFNFRNPTQHPDEIHTIDSAQDLLGLTIPAINMMVSLMRPGR
jgi:hypothetical protein